MKKRPLTIFLAVAAALLIFGSLLASASESFTLDDVLGAIVGKSEIPDGADINKDGKVDVLDAILLKNNETYNGVTLRYDDRYTFVPGLEGALTFSSSDPSVVSVDENGKCVALKVSSDPVTVTASNGTESETLRINRVDKAVINLFFVTGQSNANGCYDLANDRGELQLTMAEQLENVEQPDEMGQVYSYNALCNQYGNDKIGHPEIIGGYPLNELYDMATAKNNGFASALGKKYYELSGEKVCMIQTARNATSIEVWLRPGHKDSATWTVNSKPVNLYQATLDAYDDLMTNYLTSDKFEIHHVLNFWDQGNTCMTQNFNPDRYGIGLGGWGDSEYRTVSGLPLMTDKQYYDYFMDIHDAMKEDFGLEYSCIILARSVSSLISGESRELQLYTDLNAIRCSQYGLNNTQDEVLLCSRVGDYVRALTSTDTESYGYGMMGLDFNHYNQTGFNEQGRVSAAKMYSVLHSPVECTSVELIDKDGRTRLDPTYRLSLKVGDTYFLTAFALPEDCHEKLTFSSSDESVATVSEFGLVTGISEGEVTVTVTTESGKTQSVSFMVWNFGALTQVEYRWDFNGDLKSSLDENDLSVTSDTVKAGKKTAYKMTDGILDTTDGVDFRFYHPVTISSDFDWTIEYKAKFRQVGSLIGQSNYVSNSSRNYIYVCYTVAPSTYEYSFRIADRRGVINFLPFAATKEEAVAMNTVWNTWRVQYEKATNDLTLYRLNESSSEWEIVCRKQAVPFTMEADCLFARNDATGAYTTNALMDYFYIKTFDQQKAYETVEYEYEFNGDFKEKNGKNDLSMSELAVSNGAESNYSFEDGIYKVSASVPYVNRPDFVFDKPIHITHLTDWSIEYIAKFNAASVLLGQTDNDYGQIYNAYTVVASGWDHPMQLRLDNRVNRDIPYISSDFGDFTPYCREMNRWKLEYTAANNTMTLYFWDVQGNFFTFVGSVKLGAYDITFTNLFGRSSEGGTVNFAGEMDYLKITYSKQLS